MGAAGDAAEKVEEVFGAYPPPETTNEAIADLVLTALIGICKGIEETNEMLAEFMNNERMNGRWIS